MTLSARGDLGLAQAVSGGALALSAGGTLRSDEGLSAQAGARVDAGELQVLGRWTVNGDLAAHVARGLALDADVQAFNVSLLADSLTLGNGVTLTSGGALAVDSGRLLMGAGSLLDSAGGARLVTLGDQTLARVKVLGDLLLQSGGAMRLVESTSVQGHAQVNAQSLAIDGGWFSSGDLRISAAQGWR